MLVICEMFSGGVEGRKVRELRDFLQQNIVCRSVDNEAAFKKVCHFIRRYVNELNALFGSSAAITFKSEYSSKNGSGQLGFYRPGSPAPFITLRVLSVKPYEEGGCHV